MKLPPAREKAVLAEALKLVSEPFEITMPGFDVLPSTKLRLLLPNVKYASPLIDKF